MLKQHNSRSVYVLTAKGPLLLGGFERLDFVRVRVQVGRYWGERVCQSSVSLHVTISTRTSEPSTRSECKYHSAT